MRWTGITALAALALSLVACVTVEPAADHAAPVTAGHGEERAIAGAGGRVRRDGARLIVSLGNGGTMEFSDYRGKPQGGMFWDSVSHLYRGRLGEGRYHLVERTAYGRTHGVLIETATGASWSVPGAVLLSPDGERLLVIPDEAGNKRLQVWALTSGRPKIELDALPNRPVRFDSWQAGDRIALRVPDDGVMQTVWLERSWGAWDLPPLLRP